MIVTTVATVQYECYLTDEEAEKVRAKAEEFGGDMTMAAWVLYYEGKIDLYRETEKLNRATEAVLEVDDSED